jgi:hypothetical protein
MQTSVLTDDSEPPHNSTEATMRIGWIGGIERNEAELVRQAARCGHEMVFHGGHPGGRGAGEVRSLVERVDLVILVTGVNSHGAVQLAKKLIRQYEKRSLIVRKLGAARFQALLDAMNVAEPRLRTAPFPGLSPVKVSHGPRPDLFFPATVANAVAPALKTAS